MVRQPGRRMMQAAIMGTAHNPFSTRYVRPDAMPYWFSDAGSAAILVRRLKTYNWRAQIVGPHGSGKTTLLHSLAPELETAGRRIDWYTLHEGQRTLPNTAGNLESLSQDTLLVVDGLEQLGLPARLALRRTLARTGAGLLATTHRPLRWPVRLPVLMQVASSLELVQQLVARLTADDPHCPITPGDVETCYRRCRQNVRDTFFALYDLYEQRCL